MCELLGLTFNMTVRPNISFKGFRGRGESNPDGWGLAWYPDKAAQFVKEPIKAGLSALNNFLSDYNCCRSKIFISHVRRASAGSVSYRNTHPFYRELDGREYIFAHNGTLRQFKSKLSLGRFKPLGETDSEFAFCSILSWLEEKGVSQWTDDLFISLADKLKQINELGKFNCIFSDGVYLFCYRDKSDVKGLSFVSRVPPYGNIRMLDDDIEINLASEKDPRQKGFIIATEPLTNERWERFQPSELIVFKDGEIIYSSSDRVDTLAHANKSLIKEVLKYVRASPTRVSMLDIIGRFSKVRESFVIETVLKLVEQGYLRQDRRDQVPSNDYSATFFTEPAKRQEIENLLNGK